MATSPLFSNQFSNQFPNKLPNQLPSQPSTTFNPPVEKISSEAIVLQMGDAVLAATETVNCLVDRMEELAGHVQQQGYQIFALTEEVQNLTLLHQGTLDRLETLMLKLESQNPARSPN